MKKINLNARKFVIIYRNVNKLQYPLTLDSCFKKVSEKFKLSVDLKTLAIGISPTEEDFQDINIFFYFTKRRNIIKPQKYFSFILDYPCEARTCTSKSKELSDIMSMTFSNCWGETGLKTNLEAMHIENEVKRGRTPVMFFDAKETGLRHLLYHSSVKIERFSKYKQLYNHIKHLREKSMVLFDINKIQALGESFPLNYSKKSLQKLISILVFLNQHAIPHKRHYKSKMLHLWSNKPGLGKTSLINLLKSVSPCYKWPDDNWFDHYENNLYQWILWDEFRATGISSEFLKRLFAGDEMRLPVKGSHAYKSDNPLIVLSSNFSLQTHIWRKVRDKNLRVIELAAFKERIHEIEVTEDLIPCDFDIWLNFMKDSLLFLKK